MTKRLKQKVLFERSSTRRIEEVKTTGYEQKLINGLEFDKENHIIKINYSDSSSIDSKKYYFNKAGDMTEHVNYDYSSNPYKTYYKHDDHHNLIALIRSHHENVLAKTAFEYKSFETHSNRR